MLNLTQNKKQIRRTLNTTFTIRLVKSKIYGNTIGSAARVWADTSVESRSVNRDCLCESIWWNNLTHWQTYLSFDPTVPILVIYHTDTFACTGNDVCTKVILCNIAANRNRTEKNQNICQLGEPLKLWYIHTIKYLATI